MMNHKELYAEYDDILIGKRRKFSERNFSRDNAKSMNNALIVMKYAFEKYLRWSPETLVENLNKELMCKLRLDTLMRFLVYPVEYNKSNDLTYLVNLIYGDKKNLFRDKTIHTYESILTGKISKYPKDYFTGNDGMVRGGICLQYMISHFVLFSDLNELYYIFSSEIGYEYLKKYKLYNFCKEAFETPIDFLYFILPSDQKIEILYHYYKYKYLKEMIVSNGRKKKVVNDYKLKGRVSPL